LDFTAQSTASQAVPSNLSIAVFLIDSLQAIAPENIQTYLWLASDLKGSIESPEYYFNAGDKNAAAAMENLLLTQGWRRFRWNEVFQNAKNAFPFPPEYEGHLVSGKIVRKTTGAPVPNSHA
jgi:hypothetical protein